jgi:hypothetical protein
MLRSQQIMRELELAALSKFSITKLPTLPTSGFGFGFGKMK